ncbi:MAG: hypothetical protein MJ171_03375 [Clostridia bacterium]|nr:hypothetical protein [Clostridia bacterium]
MRLTEVLACVVLLVISAGVAGGALIAGQKGSLRLEGNTRVLMSVLDTDLFLRNEASLIDVPYFESLEGKRKDIEELFKEKCRDKGIEVKSLSFEYKKETKTELVKIEWELNGRDYVTREYIRQRVFDD